MKQYKKMFSIIIAISVILLNFAFQSIGFSAASQNEIDLVKKRINELDKNFFPNIYKAGEEIDKAEGTSYYTKESMDGYTDTLIRDVIKDASENQKLTYENFNEEIKENLKTNIWSSWLWNPITEAYKNILDEYEKTNTISVDLQPMVIAFTETIKDMLGLEPKPTPTPTPKPSGLGGGGGGGAVVITTPNPTPTPVVEAGFSDLQNYAWATEAINTLRNLGVINGVTEKTFEPSANVTREQFVKMLAVLVKLDTSNLAVSFDDVNKGDWYYPYVAKMFEKGYVKGLNSTKFGVGTNISREDMAVLMYRIYKEFAGNVADNNKGEVFGDEANISDYAKEAVSFLRGVNIIKGTPENKFNSKNPATRAEAAQMLYNFFKAIEDKIK